MPRAAGRMCVRRAKPADEFYGILLRECIVHAVGIVVRVHVRSVGRRYACQPTMRARKRCTHHYFHLTLHRVKSLHFMNTGAMALQTIHMLFFCALRS